MQAKMAYENESIVVQQIISNHLDHQAFSSLTDWLSDRSTRLPEPDDDRNALSSSDDKVFDEEPGRDNQLKYFHKRRYVVNELIETEKIYIMDLAMVVEGYMKAIQDKEVTLPPTLDRKDVIVFGNIHQIYDWHKDTFHHELEKCKHEPEKLGNIFIHYEKRLYMYVKYCENKPKSESIVAENMDFFEDIRQRLGHRLQLPDMLIKPVQRIMKYQLMLKEILKYTDRAGDDIKNLQRAVEVMCIIPKAANDMMNVGRLQGFVGKITAQGKLLLQDNLLVTEHAAKTKIDKQMMRERQVFLFEQIIIFSEEMEKKKSNLSSPGYIYKNCIQVNKMSLDENIYDDPLRFVLIDKAPLHSIYVTCQAPNEDVRENWVSQIKSILDMQGDFLRALQSPIAYQNELSKELSTPDIASLQLTNPMRKTQSQSKSKKFLTAIHLRKQNSPASSNSSAVTSERSDSLHSPTDKSQPSSKFVIMSKAAAAFGSPKPKRNLFEGFKQTLKSRKGKGSENCISYSKDRPYVSGNSPSSSVIDQTFSDMASGNSLCSTSRSNSEDYSSIRIS